MAQEAFESTELAAQVEILREGIENILNTAGEQEKFLSREQAQNIVDHLLFASVYKGFFQKSAQMLIDGASKIFEGHYPNCSRALQVFNQVDIRAVKVLALERGFRESSDTLGLGICIGLESGISHNDEILEWLRDVSVSDCYKQSSVGLTT